MKSTYIKIKIQYCLMLVLASLIVLGITVQSCNKEEDMPLVLDEEILNSSELEDFIIAGAEYKKALASFEIELNKIDFSTLEVTYTADGKKVAHLPITFVEATQFDEKERSFYEKKDAFRKKFPHFSSFSEDIGKKYFQQCVKKSVKVNSVFLKLGIDTTLPKLKSGSEYDENLSYLMWQLYNWVNSPYYVEIYILGYADGSYGTVQIPGATSTYAREIEFDIIGGSWYYNGQQVISVGHTHNNHPTPTKETKDENGNIVSDYFNTPPGVSRFIYYGGSFYYY